MGYAILTATLLLLIQFSNGMDLINITSPDPSPTVLIGDPINLIISYNSTPSLIIWTANSNIVAIWRSQGQSIAASYKNRLTLKKQYILINGSTMEDSGEYMVTVNDASGNSGSFTFDVVVKDRFLAIQSNDTGIYKMGENISLTIWYDGNPLGIFWDYNGNPLVSRIQTYSYVSPRFKERMVLQDSGSLLIYNTTNDDLGNYSISVTTTTILSGSKSFQVKFFDPVGNITVTQSPNVVSESSTAVDLSCSASSGYTDSVTWTKDGQPIVNTSTYNLLDGNQTLWIMQPNRTFSGNYSCNISNPVYWSSGSLQLRVYDPVGNVTVTQSPHVVSGSSTAVNLSCSASSGYTEALTWTKDGQPIVNTSAYNLSDGNQNLQIIATSRTFSGNYSCNISNAAYWSLGSLQLHVYDATIRATSTYSMVMITLLGGILLGQ